MVFGKFSKLSKYYNFVNMAGDGTVSVNALKLRMQEVSEELNKYKSLHDFSENELEKEKAKTKAVSYFLLLVNWLNYI